MNEDLVMSAASINPHGGREERTMQIEPWIGAEQVAFVLGVSTDWVYEKAVCGDIPSYKFGGHRRFRVSEVENWASAHAAGRRAA